MRAFARVLWLARRHAGWVAAVVVSMAVVSFATVFALNLIRPLYDQVLSRPAEGATGAAAVLRPPMVRWLDGAAAWLVHRLAPEGASATLGILLLVLAAIVLKNAGTFVARYAVAQLGLATVRDLRNRLFDAILRQSPGFFGSHPSGVLISRVVNDVRMVQEAVAERLGDLLQSTVTLAGVLLYLFSLNARLSLTVLVAAPVLLAPIVHFARRLKQRSRQSQERMGELASVLDEAVGGMKVIQAFGAERFEAERFRRASWRHFWVSLRARAIQIANAPVMETLGAMGALALVAYAGRRIAAGTMTVGDFSAFVFGLWAAYAPVKNLNQFNFAVQQAAVASERIFEVLDHPVEVTDGPRARPLGTLEEGIRLEDVWFAYEDERWVLRGLSLEVPLGATVALVGPSGAGKTTVGQLVLRFWDPQRGRVTVGGADVRSVELASLRSKIGLVDQETVLFNDTVRANIAAGREDIPLERIQAAARAAHAHEFIARLPRGYDTVIGERGMTLSGGERQRLAIARALVKDPPILVLDEATASLDAEAERLVQEALENLMRGRTTLVIAHRLATVRSADRIVVLDGGRIVESGSFDELVALGGRFAGMVRDQRLHGNGEG